MDQVHHLITERVSRLIDEAEELKPDSPVVFEVMSDEQLLQTTAGAATVTDNLGNEVIYVDPSRTTEYIVAHEVMHLVLHRSGWPQMYCIIPQEADSTAKWLADEVDNILDYLTFDPRLEALGFDVEGYRRWYLSVLQDWPTEQTTGAAILWKALRILDALFWGGRFRDKALETAASRQPESSELARQLHHVASRARARTKSNVRLAMVEVLDFLDGWITTQTGAVQHLRQRIGISPLFTKAQLRQPVSRTVGFESHPFTISSKRFWIGGLILNSDGTRFRNYVCPEATSEPPEFDRVRDHLQTLSLRQFIEAEEIRKYGTFP